MKTRIFLATIAVFTAALPAASAQDEAAVSVRETGGTYVVTARFSVPEAAGVVREVLTDYASIPRFMPDVRTSEVLERQEGYARVEQETVSKYMFFSKRVHLVLDVDEGAGVIRFRDRCRKSFVRYEGAWNISEDGDRTGVSYELTAQPAFSVPEFVLRRLLNRDAKVMIERLRNEFRVSAQAGLSTVAR